MADNEVTSSRYLYYEDLHYIPEEQKLQPIWAAQALVFAKYNCQPIVDRVKLQKHRRSDMGIIDAQPLKELFDPKVDGEGGTAEYVATDWLSNPIHIHLLNITEANQEKIPLNLYVKSVDEYAKLKQQKDNDKIIGRKAYIKFINSINTQLGYPLLKDSDDPYKYAAQMQAQQDGKKIPTQEPMGIVDNIKMMINDSEDLMLYNGLIYKGAHEIAIELGIKYFFNENKYPLIGAEVIADIRRVNAAVGRWYTDLEDGRPVIEYMDMMEVMVSPFKKKDGEDISQWYYEPIVKFRDFVRMIGKNLNEDQLKKVFEMNKQKGGCHGLEWSNCTDQIRDSATIQIGYCNVLSQNCDVYAAGDIKGNPGFKKKSLDWYPSPKTVNKYKSKRVEKHYNVWYEFYYIPIGITCSTIADDSRITSADFERQAEYIFGLKKVQDMQRYGNDRRLCKPPLIIWRNNRMSFADIMDRYMPKIDFLWQKFQNDLANDMPHGLVFAEELLELMVTTADDNGKGGINSKKDFIKKIKQTGYGIAKMMKSDGKVINDGKPFVEISTGHLDSATKKLLMMMDLYNMCRQALGIDPVGEGVAPKPRQSLGGIQLALDAGTSANWSMEKGYMDWTLEAGYRMMNYIVQIANTPDSQRLQDFKDVIGQANGMALEAIKDIPKHKLGLSIENINTDQAKARLNEIVNKLVEAKLIDIEALFLIPQIDNYKYAVVLMIMMYKKKQIEIKQQSQTEFEREVQLRQMDLNIKKQDYMNRADAEATLLNLSKKWDERIETELAAMKSHSQQILKEKTGDNREKEAAVKIQKTAEEKNKEKILQTT